MDHRVLARAYAYAIALALLLIGLTAAWIRIELATEGAHQTIEVYWAVFSTHALIGMYGLVPLAITATIGHRMLPELLGRPGLALIGLGWVALLATLIGTALLIALATPLRALLMPSFEVGLLVLGAAAISLLGLGAAGMGVPLIATCLTPGKGSHSFDSPLALGLLCIGIGQVVGGCVMNVVALGLAGHSTLEPTGIPPTWLEFGALAAITQVMSGDAPLRGRSRAALAVAMPLLALAALIDWIGPALVEVDSFAGPSNLLGCIGTLVLVILWIDLARTRPLAAGPQRVLVRGFVFAFVLRSLVAYYLATLSVDIHLHDTYFVVSLDHLRTMMALHLALPAALLWCWTKLDLPTPRERWWSAAAWVSTLAVPTFAILTTMLGHQGMPRRYMVYLPEYWSLQFASSVVGAVLAIGTLIWALDLARAAWASRE